MPKKVPPKDIHHLFRKGMDKLEADFEMLPAGTKDLFVEKKNDECLEKCNIALADNPYNIGALMYKGLILKDQEKYVESNECFDLFLNQFSKFPIVYQNQIENYIKLEEYGKAMDAGKECLALFRDNAYVWSLVALCSFLDGSPDLAYAFLDEAEKHVEESKHTLYMMRGILLEKEGKKDDALMSFIKFQEMTNSNEDFMAERIYNLMK